MTVRDTLLAWMDQFENGHYEFDVYGENVSIDLPRDTVEKIMDISLQLCDRVVEAKGELSSAEYENLESIIRKEHPDDKYQFFVVEEAVHNERLYGRYNDIESKIFDLNLRGYPTDSAACILTVVIEIRKLIYAVIRHVDDAEDNYLSLAYTFFIGVLTIGWGEGLGWSKDKEGNWSWNNKS